MTALFLLLSTMYNLITYFLVFSSAFMLNFGDGKSRGYYKYNVANRPDCSYGLCEDVNEYPEKDIFAIIKQNKVIHSFFGNVVKPLGIISASSRISGDDPEPFCKTIDRTVMPQWMEDANGRNRTIVNVKEFIQAVTFQTCESGQRCFVGEILNRKAKCLQVYSIVKLLTVDVNRNTSEYHPFRIPSTCICAYV